MAPRLKVSKLDPFSVAFFEKKLLQKTKFFKIRLSIEILNTKKLQFLK